MMKIINPRLTGSLLIAAFRTTLNILSWGSVAFIAGRHPEALCSLDGNETEP